MPDAAFRILRSRRKTLAVTVSAGSVLVRAPYGVSDAAIRAFVASKRAWIERKLEEYADERFAAVRRGETLLDAGAERAVRFGAPRDGEDALGFFLRAPSSVRRYFERTRGPVLVEALHAHERAIGVQATDVRLRDFKARWGSCDARGVICLNWRLTMLPARLRDYVLVHELCHLRRMDHSPAFWNEVGRFCPDAPVLRRQLKRYSFLCLLYRGERGA